jgi:NAD+ diphosphatase
MEEAVMREVMEETGVPVLRVRYHSSQPWPFPASLMIGFMAEAERLVEPSIDPRELEAACWFSPADIARFGEHGRSLPRLDSIARRLIEDWLSTCP